MVDPKKINIDQLPKKLCDGAVGGYSKELFSFALTSGNSLDSFAVTPTTMKSIAFWISKQVAEYEKTFGTIDMARESVESPIQPSDLK